MTSLRGLKLLVRALLFPIYSLFKPEIGFAIFYPSCGGWRCYTRGKTFQVREPRLWVLEYFRHFVPQTGDLIFDVGGEMGYETSQFAELVGPAGKVVTFECLPGHIKLLKEIALRSNNVTVVERACWNKVETLEFSIGRTPGSGTAISDVRGQAGQDLADPTKQKIYVHADLLDNMWREYGNGKPVDFLKMDIEGAEYEALEGATEILKRTRRAVIAAYHIRDGIRTSGRVAKLLGNSGFRVKVDENHHVYAER